MWTLLNAFDKDMAQAGVHWLMDMGIKGGVLMVFALGTVFVMRRRSAATRHLIWTLAMGGLLVLPWLSAWGPTFSIPILPAVKAPGTGVATTAVSGLSDASQGSHVPSISLPTTDSSAHPTTPLLPADTSDSPLVTPWQGILFVWLTGWVVLMAHVLTGMYVTRRLIHEATALGDSRWQRMLTQLTAQLRIDFAIPLLRSRSQDMPMVCGILRPVMLLPKEAEHWTLRERRTVLIHELAHIKRRDCLTHCMARVALALHWFNPLAWVALRYMRIDREQACDDGVLNAGSEPEDYAGQLVQIARAMKTSAWTSGTSVSMARKSQLEGRLSSILDARRNRHTLTPRVIWLGALLGVIIAVVLSVLSLTTSDENRSLNPRASTLSVPPSRIHELIYVVRHYTLPTPRRFDRSLDAVRELTEIGAPAVPELLAELKRGGNGFEQSLIFLTLRVIQDRRAVPVLADMIEAIDYGGSDRGFGDTIASEVNTAFLVKHAWGRPLGYKTDHSYTPLGRPASELRSTLATLTGLDGGHEYTAPGENDELKTLRTQTAKTYRTWWLAHKDEVDGHLDALTLDSLSPAHINDPIETIGTSLYGAFITQSPGVRLGEVMHVSLSAAPTAYEGIDLDTGQIFRREGNQTPKLWKQSHGIDTRALARGMANQPDDGLLHTTDPEGMFVWMLENHHWDTIEAALQQDTLIQMGNPNEGFHFNPKYYHYPRTYFFRTASGTAGILQIAGLNTKTKRMEFKYRLVEGSSLVPDQSRDKG
jgi:beta-lactamase regulating signal transducer with metallopeptidase domain